MNKRQAKIIALENCAALIEQQIMSHFGFIEFYGDETEEDLDKVVKEAESIRDRLHERADSLKEQGAAREKGFA